MNKAFLKLRSMKQDTVSDPIIDCHGHSFETGILPPKYLPLGLTKTLELAPVRFTVSGILDLLGDRWEVCHRARRFILGIEAGTQRDNYDLWMRAYPVGSRAVVLPMDFEQAGMGKPRVSVEEQIREARQFSDLVFCPIDPRRPNLLGWTMQMFKDYDLTGLKVYGPLGYSPADKGLWDVYEWAEYYGVPIISHYGGTSVRGHGVSVDQAKEWMQPNLMKPVLEEFPKLKYCYAHFGGVEAWGDFMERHAGPVTDIVHMMQKHENVCTDVSYTMMGCNVSWIYMLARLLDSKDIRSKINYGSDSYMCYLATDDVSKDWRSMREILGPQYWRKISWENPSKFLGL